MRLVKKRIKNTKDIDMYVKNCFGEELIIFPGEERTIVVLKDAGAKKKHDRS